MWLIFCGTASDVARHFEGQAVGREEAEAIAAAQRIQILGREDDAAT
jgi:hypothetical protein